MAGWIWAEMSHFCYVLWDCCYPYASLKLEPIQYGMQVRVTVKVHSVEESGIGDNPVGPLALKLEHGCQYQVIAKTNDASSAPKGFTWLHGHDAVCKMILQGVTAGETLKIMIGDEEVVEDTCPDVMAAAPVAAPATASAAAPTAHSKVREPGNGNGNSFAMFNINPGPVTEAAANNRQAKVQRWAEKHCAGDLREFFPEVVFSYATGTRKGMDGDGSISEWNTLLLGVDIAHGTAVGGFQIATG